MRACTRTSESTLMVTLVSRSPGAGSTWRHSFGPSGPDRRGSIGRGGLNLRLAIGSSVIPGYSLDVLAHFRLDEQTNGRIDEDLKVADAARKLCKTLI